MASATTQLSTVLYSNCWKRHCQIQNILSFLDDFFLTFGEQLISCIYFLKFDFNWLSNDLSKQSVSNIQFITKMSKNIRKIQMISDIEYWRSAQFKLFLVTFLKVSECKIRNICLVYIHMYLLIFKQKYILSWPFP